MLSCSFLRLLHKFFSVKFQSGYQMWILHIANHTATKRVTCRATCKGRRQALKFENFYCLWHHYMWLDKVHFWWLCGLQCAIFISDKISVHLSKECLIQKRFAEQEENHQTDRGGGGTFTCNAEFYAISDLRTGISYGPLSSMFVVFWRCGNKRHGVHEAPLASFDKRRHPNCFQTRPFASISKK